MEHFDKLLDENLKNKKKQIETKISSRFGVKIKNIVEIYNNKNKEPEKKINNQKSLREFSNKFQEKKEDNKRDEKLKRIIKETKPKSKINDIPHYSN